MSHTNRMIVKHTTLAIEDIQLGDGGQLSKYLPYRTPRLLGIAPRKWNSAASASGASAVVLSTIAPVISTTFAPEIALSASDMRCVVDGLQDAAFTEDVGTKLPRSDTDDWMNAILFQYRMLSGTTGDQGLLLSY